MIELISNIDLSSYANTIKYIKPDGIEGYFIPDTVLETKVQYTTKLNEEGIWTFWVYSVDMSDTVFISTSVKLRIWREGE